VDAEVLFYHAHTHFYFVGRLHFRLSPGCWSCFEKKTTADAAAPGRGRRRRGAYVLSFSTLAVVKKSRNQGRCYSRGDVCICARPSSESSRAGNRAPLSINSVRTDITLRGFHLRNYGCWVSTNSGVIFFRGSFDCSFNKKMLILLSKGGTAVLIKKYNYNHL